MTERRYFSEGSKCGACGDDLGRQEVWTLVFNDDPPELVQRVLSGEINWVQCPQCGFDGGWLWPPVFTYVIVPEERAVCITLAKAANQLLGLVQEALDVDPIRQRGLDPSRLLSRTAIAHDHRHIAAALETPVEQVELEYQALQHCAERSSLHGRERIEHLVQSTLSTGAISLDPTEHTPEFFDEIEEYRTTLRGDEDPRIPQILQQLSDGLGKALVRTRKKLPKRDEMNSLAGLFQAPKTKTTSDLLQDRFEHLLSEAKADVLQLRLLRLCKLQSTGQLSPRTGAPIDLQPELSALIDQIMSSEGLEGTILSDRDRNNLPEVKKFIGTLTPEMVPPNLVESEGHDPGSPPPASLDLGNSVLSEIYQAIHEGSADVSLMDRLAEDPLAEAYVYAEVGRELSSTGALSGAMLNLSNAIKILESSFKNPSDFADYWKGRLYGICLERIGSLQQKYARFEDAIKVLRQARSVYERIGASDGALETIREEAEIWLELNQPEQAEQMYKRVVSASEGSGRVDEFRDLLNLSNVYRRLPPWLNTELRYGVKKDDEPESPDVFDETRESSEDRVSETVDVPFAKKGGISVDVTVEGHEELSFRDIVGSELTRLLYRALAVAILNGDTELEQTVKGRIVSVYGELGCMPMASLILDQILETSSLEEAGLDAQIFALNRLRQLAESQEETGESERAVSTRGEELRLMEFIIAQEGLPPLAQAEMSGERACVLEAVDRLEDARSQYRDTINQLERTRLWMRDPGNKRGLQSRRWRPYVRAARNSLRIYSQDPARVELLNEAWYYIQMGRSRALLDVIAADETAAEENSAGVASVRPAQFNEVSSRLPKDLVVLEFVLMPSSPGCPGSWALFVIEPGKDRPWLAWQEPDMESVYEAQQQLANIADECDETIVQYGFEAFTQDAQDRYISALEKLGDTLFPAGLLEKLREAKYRRLVIVADAYLQEVPFAALRPLEAGERNYLGLPTGQHGFQLIYAPSSSIFVQWADRTSTARDLTPERAALFVDPLGDLSEFNPNVAKTISEIELHMLDRRVEIRRRDGKEATPDAWFDETPDCDLVVYFGHSIAGPEEKVAALTLSDGADAVSPITAEDIFRAAGGDMFSERSLFIFASCSGGFASAGSWDSDRELRGLSVAHLYAGCGAVIAASRPLIDSPTLVLLNILVSEILGGEDAVTCLTKAQMRMAALNSSYAHPHFWGYVGLMGAPHWRFGEQAISEV